MRIANHPVLGPLPEVRKVQFHFDGVPFEGREGEPIAAALLASGVLTLRHTRGSGAPRGLFCGIGYCFECRVTVNGERGIRSCLTPVTEGMQVESGPAMGGADPDHSEG